ncbi:MAG: hypothetical protein ABSH06_31500, partial [Thermodesulfobacteriota bacterium]
CQEKNDAIAKKYFWFGGLNGKKARLERIRNAKKNHSSLLRGDVGKRGVLSRRRIDALWPL